MNEINESGLYPDGFGGEEILSDSQEFHVGGVFEEVVFPDDEFEKLNDRALDLMQRVNLVVQISEMRLRDIQVLLSRKNNLSVQINENEKLVAAMMPELVEQGVSELNLIEQLKRELSEELDQKLKFLFWDEPDGKERKNCLQEISDLHRLSTIKVSEIREAFFKLLKSEIGKIVKLSGEMVNALPKLPFFETEFALETAKVSLTQLESQVEEAIGLLVELVDYQEFSKMALINDEKIEEMIRDIYEEQYTFGVDVSFWR